MFVNTIGTKFASYKYRIYLFLQKSTGLASAFFLLKYLAGST
jgi:hypothetical protein